jgi:hypothetical protein
VRKAREKIGSRSLKFSVLGIKRIKKTIKVSEVVRETIGSRRRAREKRRK